MIIGNFKSKEDEMEKRATAMKLLQIAVDNEAEVSKRLEGYVAQAPPPVPQQEKSIAELEKDEMEQRQRLVNFLKEIKIKPDVANASVQALLSEGLGIETLVILNRSSPAIRKRFEKINPDAVDANYLTDILKAIIREYRFSAGFTFGSSGKLTGNEGDVQRLLGNTDKLLKLKGLIDTKKTEIMKNAPNAELIRLLDALKNKVDFTIDYLNRFQTAVNKQDLDVIQRGTLIEETLKLVNKGVLLSNFVVGEIIPLLSLGKSNEAITNAINKSSSTVPQDDIKLIMFGVEELLGDFNKYTGYEPPALTADEIRQAGRVEIEEYYDEPVVDLFTPEYEKLIKYADFIIEHSGDRNTYVMPSMKSTIEQYLQEFEMFMDEFSDKAIDNTETAEETELYKYITNAIETYRRGVQAFNAENARILAYIERQSLEGHKRKDILQFLQNTGSKSNIQIEKIERKVNDPYSLKYPAMKNEVDYAYAEEIKQRAINRLETDPNYDPENKPATRISEKIGLGKGNKSTMGFKAKRIKIGKGVGRVEEQPKYRTFGKYVIHNDQLQEQNRLNFKYPSLGQISHIKPVSVSDNYKEFILDILDSDKMNQKHYESLNPDEKTHFHRVVEGAGLVGKFKLKKLNDDIDEKEANRFEVLKGSMLAGNNNPQMIKELKGLTIKFIKGGKINKKEGEELLYYLLEL